MDRRCVVWTALALVLATAVAVRAEPPTKKEDWTKPISWQTEKRVDVLRRFTGGFPADGRQERLPRDVIADERTWGEFWQTLCGEKVRPEVDFETEIILVGLISDENDLFLESRIDGNGNVHSLTMATLVGY